MNANELGRIFERANESFARAERTSRKVDRSIGRATEVMRRADERGGAVREAARRERQRLNADLKRRAAKIAVAVGLISVATIALGLILPTGIGMFGFLAAVGLAIGIVGLLAFMPSGERNPTAPSANLPNGAMVQRFDSYLYRTRAMLPAPAQAEVDALSAVLPSLKQTLERVDPLDPNAQDARRLMSVHLPGLIDRYSHVPPAYRTERDGEDKSADERLVEALSASRAALADISEQLARADMAAFETHGRFIESRYGRDDGPQLVHPEDARDRDDP